MTTDARFFPPLYGKHVIHGKPFYDLMDNKIIVMQIHVWKTTCCSVDVMIVDQERLVQKGYI